MLKNTVGLLFILFSYINDGDKIASSQTNKVKIESMKIYKYFKTGGYTTVGAYTHFDVMKKDGTETIDVVDGDIKELQRILNTAEFKKHYQTKFGINNIFCEITFNGQNHESRSIISTGTDASGITDLIDKKDYIITNESDLKWLQEFVKRVKMM